MVEQELKKLSKTKPVLEYFGSSDAALHVLLSDYGIATIENYWDGWLLDEGVLSCRFVGIFKEDYTDGIGYYMFSYFDEEEAAILKGLEELGWKLKWQGSEEDDIAAYFRKE